MGLQSSTMRLQGGYAAQADNAGQVAHGCGLARVQVAMPKPAGIAQVKPALCRQRKFVTRRYQPVEAVSAYPDWLLPGVAGLCLWCGRPQLCARPNCGSPPARPQLALVMAGDKSGR